jgi:hypothetical protein
MTDDNFGTDCVVCGNPFPNKPGSITEPIDHECVDPDALWGPEGPKQGQVIDNINGLGISARWTGTYWEEVK